ncbi:MAG: hypothetical protein HYZ13_03465 [Acidobacteria bacterium]|nr:hypothetical protein [Acidobacteriota bacterium]
MEPRRPREPNSLDTAEFTYEEILERLELGRLIVQATEHGSRLATVHSATPEEERRASAMEPPGSERRTFRPIDLPTRFPESGPIHLLLVGGFADDSALRRPVPYWEDDQGGASLVWQSLYRSGFIHTDDRDFAMGLGGFWDDRPPRTQDLAMTYAGYRRRHELADVDRVLHPWNQQRLQTLALACHERSRGRLKIIALGEVARHLMCTAAYGVPGIAVLSLPEPTKEELAEMHTQGPAAEKWVDWAASLLAVGRG